ncbi:MAG TPA: sugar ABC transporter permease [Clostridia bacterium]|nr:sugar ABC transporter permease [Clostridia bacterium]
MTVTSPIARRAGPVLERLGSPAALLVAVGLFWVAFEFLRDGAGLARLFATVYDLVGLDSAAEALLQYGFDPVQAKLLLAVIAIAIGIGGVWLLFVGMNGLVDLARPRIRERLRPYIFIGPAIAMLAVYLVFPAVATIWVSLTDGGGWSENYGRTFADPEFWTAIRNNLLWLVLATGGSVVIGLIVAALTDRIKREALAKTFIFLPLAISMVGAAVIWRFMYAWRPPGETQIGAVNAAWTALGNDPVAFVQTPTLNTFALILIMIWLQTGLAMVILSAALKGVSSDVMEAARMDGASELQLFFRVVIPMISGTILTVVTTISIMVLKVFDIVYVMTGGRFESEVIANRMFTEMFVFRDFGQASALAVILFVAVIPIMVLNIRNLRRQGIGA